MSDPLTLGSLASAGSSQVAGLSSALTYSTRALTGLQLLKALLTGKKGQLVPAMARNNRRNRRVKRKGRRQRSLGYMRPIRLPVRKCVTWKETSGSEARWLYRITMGLLCNNFEKIFDEFKIVYLNVQHRPANAASVSGLYAGVLMDEGGFGDFGAATAASWFPTIASMPGAKVQPPHLGMRFRWRPTEPDARQWRSYQRGEEHERVVCTLYFADNGDNSVELGGVLIITGLIMVRGKYYNTQVTQALNLRQEHDTWDLCSEADTP